MPSFMADSEDEGWDLEGSSVSLLDPHRQSSFLSKKDKMPDMGMGTQNFKSHVYKIARLHLHDWILLTLLYVIDHFLNKIEPFHRFVGRDMMMDLRYPLRSETVPFRVVQLVGILLPTAIILGVYFRRRNVYDLHHAILGLFFSVLITAVLTDAIKVAVGRPRPDFFWRCFPDGKDVYDNITTSVICHGEKSVINQGHRSFPSGHSSWSFACLGFLSWYLAGKLRAFDRRGHIAKLCVVFLPLLGAMFVAISRVNDYWHHWQDVLVGGLLGVIVASFCYLQFFPPPHDADGWFPHAYLQAVADTRVTGVSNIPSSLSSRSSETKVRIGPKHQREFT